MSRVFRATEVSSSMNIPQDGQHVHAKFFCINCHAVGSSEVHYPECNKRESYAIPSSAEVPRKYAKKRIWDIFKKQFVFAKPTGWWQYSEDSWYYKNTKG